MAGFAYFQAAGAQRRRQLGSLARDRRLPLPALPKAECAAPGMSSIRAANWPGQVEAERAAREQGRRSLPRHHRRRLALLPGLVQSCRPKPASAVAACGWMASEGRGASNRCCLGETAAEQRFSISCSGCCVALLRTRCRLGQEIKKSRGWLERCARVAPWASLSFQR